MEIEAITLGVAIVGVASGLTGAVLGIMNTWRNIRRDKVRLSVQATWAITALLTGKVDTNLQVRVVNLSEFPVTVSDVGFKLRRGKIATLANVPGIEPSGSLPIRLEPRTAYSKVFGIEALSNIASELECAYANTECGVVATGNRRGLQNLIRQISKSRD